MARTCWVGGIEAPRSWLRPFSRFFHLPNIPLVIASFLGALVWCLLFIRVPSFPGAWLSQAILTGCLILFFKHGFLNQFQVGKPGHRYEYYGGGVNVAGGYDSNRETVCGGPARTGQRSSCPGSAIRCRRQIKGGMDRAQGSRISPARSRSGISDGDRVTRSSWPPARARGIRR